MAGMLMRTNPEDVEAVLEDKLPGYSGYLEKLILNGFGAAASKKNVSGSPRTARSIRTEMVIKNREQDGRNRSR